MHAPARLSSASTRTPDEPWATIPRAGAEDVDAAVRAARGAFEPWAKTTAITRARLLRRLAELIAENASRIAVVETTDNGKLIREMEGQLRGLADYYHYYAGAADKVGGETLAGRSRQLLRLHAARAARRRRRDHAVELARAADELEGGARAGGRAARSSSSPPSRRRPRRWSSRR